MPICNICFATSVIISAPPFSVNPGEREEKEIEKEMRGRSSAKAPSSQEKR
jgi:hypothetical protein